MKTLVYSWFSRNKILLYKQNLEPQLNHTCSSENSCKNWCSVKTEQPIFIHSQSLTQQKSKLILLFSPNFNKKNSFCAKPTNNYGFFPPRIFSLKTNNLINSLKHKVDSPQHLTQKRNGMRTIRHRSGSKHLRIFCRWSRKAPRQKPPKNEHGAQLFSPQTHWIRDSGSKRPKIFVYTGRESRRKMLLFCCWSVVCSVRTPVLFADHFRFLMPSFDEN